ncbi:hypothetical protein C8Q77DRAFT_1150036 [Trametes polyzona]|nr:hypothetical protein C8Q77DRAFT_1150036 [Trametes polyzona]
MGKVTAAALISVQLLRKSGAMQGRGVCCVPEPYGVRGADLYAQARWRTDVPVHSTPVRRRLLSAERQFANPSPRPPGRTIPYIAWRRTLTAKLECTQYSVSTPSRTAAIPIPMNAASPSYPGPLAVGAVYGVHEPASRDRRHRCSPEEPANVIEVSPSLTPSEPWLSIKYYQIWLYPRSALLFAPLLYGRHNARSIPTGI